MGKTIANLIWLFCSKLIEWAFRRRGIARILIGAGLSVLALVMAGSWLGKLSYRDAERTLDVSVSTSDAFPPWVSWSLLGVAIFLLAVGLGLALFEAWKETRSELRSKVVVVELRGLHSTPDTPLEQANLDLPGVRQPILIDFRPVSESELVNPSAALQKISGLKPTLSALTAGQNRADLHVVVGGIAPVPTLVLAGCLLDDESSVTVFDWDRNIKTWRRTDQVDDGVRLLPLVMPEIASGCEDAVLAVSASYEIRADDLDSKFGSLPRVVLTSPPPLAADRFWSSEKQQAYVAAIRDAIQQLTAVGIKRIHLVLAAPSSLSIRVGMAYDRRLSAELVVYQFERSCKPSYPWGLLLPAHGNAGPSVVR